MTLEALHFVLTGVFCVEKSILFDPIKVAGLRMTEEAFLLINLSFSFHRFLVTIETIHACLDDWLMIEFRLSEV